MLGEHQKMCAIEIQLGFPSNSLYTTLKTIDYYLHIYNIIYHLKIILSQKVAL